MKKAFTLLELVFIIVIIGILVTIMIPDSRSTKLREAAAQLVSHIRYTQHLAMVDDKFRNEDSPDTHNPGNFVKWYKHRWSIRFNRDVHSLNQWAYTIFSDTAGNSTGQVDAGEVARDPQDNNKILCGGIQGANALDIDHATFQGTRKMNLGLTYGITDIDFDGGCTTQSFGFDNLGRPFNSRFNNDTQAYINGDLIQARCDIQLTSSDGTVTVSIEPETGYTYIQ